MSFAATISLKNAAAAAESFLRLFQKGDTVEYMLSTSTVSAPVKLTIGHQPAKTNDGNDRRMVKLSRTVIGTDLKPRTVVWTLTGSIPRSSITRVNTDDCLAELKEFISTPANVDALMRGEL